MSLLPSWYFVPVAGLTDPIRATAPVRAFQEGIIGQVPRVSMDFSTQILTRALSVPGQGIIVSSHPPVDHDWFPRLTPNEGEYGHIIKQNNNTKERGSPRLPSWFSLGLACHCESFYGPGRA